MKDKFKKVKEKRFSCEHCGKPCSCVVGNYILDKWVCNTCDDLFIDEDEMPEVDFKVARIKRHVNKK